MESEMVGAFVDACDAEEESVAAAPLRLPVGIGPSTPEERKRRRRQKRRLPKTGLGTLDRLHAKDLRNRTVSLQLDEPLAHAPSEDALIDAIEQRRMRMPRDVPDHPDEFRVRTRPFDPLMVGFRRSG